ncbi:response regulator [Marinobacter sp. CHS3-4]|uniref:response regulator n=1 Tax=Marinobacter sp. CHS3-4 TaxID=3045174 RepID=UPI0024B5DE32|nr:response regulator [Marinobacter sp. CHS3-4]MDI9244342.1 response regulator [Marinobacter sp. CHS3-4]
MPSEPAAPVILRYEHTSDLDAFQSVFAGAFDIIPCRTDEEARHRIDHAPQAPAALVMIQPSLRNLGKSELLAQASNAGCFRILISDQLALDDIVHLLDERVIDRCYERPWDEKRLRTDLFTATMGVGIRDRSEPAAHEAPAADHTESRPLVLIVDDETAATKYLSKQLLRMQERFGVRCAASADEALNILRNEGDRIAVLMTDQRMPGMKGDQLISELRQSYPYITRILTSAYGELDVALGAVNEGRIFGYEKKPWNAANLRPVLEDAIAQHFRLKAQAASRQVQTSSSFQSSRERRRTRLMEALADPAPQALATAEVIDRFLSTLETIHTLNPGKAHLRALELPELDQALIRGLRVEVTSLTSPENGTREFHGHEIPAAIPEALATLLTASGLTTRSLEITESDQALTIASGPDQPLRMYSHLLSPLTGVSNPLLEQQGALLALFIWADRLGGHLNIHGGQHSFGLTLSLPSRKSARSLEDHNA